jgi:DNA-binding transcriptional ArsR family regulator
MSKKSKEKKCNALMDMFSLLSNEIRFKTLCLLSEGDYCVNDIVKDVNGKPSNVSQQLKMLTVAGYVSRRREGKRVYYHLEDAQIKKVITFLHDVFDN